MRFSFELVPDAGVMPPFIRKADSPDETLIEASDGDLLADVWSRAASDLGFSIGYDIDQPVARRSRSSDLSQQTTSAMTPVAT